MSKQRAYQLAKEIGCEITYEGDLIRLDAMYPMKFRYGDTHCREYNIEDGIRDPWSGQTVWQEIIEDLKYGIENCETNPCEICAGLQIKLIRR